MTISNPTDIFKAIPMVQQLDKQSVLIEIIGSIKKCILGLGITMSDFQIAMLSKDIYEVYSYESLEDVQQCLKKARQGEYDFQHFKRDVISMPLLRHWMTLHLEDKSRLREKIIEERKKPNDHEIVDSEVAKIYLGKIKQMLKEKSTPKELEPNKTTNDFWLKELYKYRAQRLVFKLIRKKHRSGLLLSKREELFVDQWNVRQFL